MAKKTVPTLYLMVGLPGSGKTTFSKALAKETKAMVLESDKVRKALYPQPTHTGRESSDVFKTIMAGAREYGAQGKSCIVDATNLASRDRRPFYDLARASGFEKFVTIFVRCDPRVAIERLKNKEKGNLSNATEEVYWRMAEKNMGEFPYGMLMVDGAADTQATLVEIMEAVKHWPILRS